MMTDFLKRKFTVFLVVITLIVAILAGTGAILFKNSGGKSNMVTDAVGIIVTPIQGAFSWVFGNISDVFNFFGTIKQNRDDNIALKKEVVTLQREKMELEGYKDENDRLRSLLDLKLWNRDYETVGAEVVARNENNMSGVVKINKGSLDGISKNDVVTESTGLVGYVTEIGTTWANVTTIVSPSSNVSCIMPRTGEIVMVGGNVKESKNNTCIMSFIPSESTISTGEAIETSGEGGIFPKGLFVGRVEKIADEKNGISKEAIIKPTANFENLREVLVIKTVKETNE